MFELVLREDPECYHVESHERCGYHGEFRSGFGELAARPLGAPDPFQMQTGRQLYQSTQEDFRVILRPISHREPGSFPGLMCMPVPPPVKQLDTESKCAMLFVGKRWRIQ